MPGDRLTQWLTYSLILTATFLQKIALPFAGQKQVFFGLPVMLAITVIGFLSGRLEFKRTRLALYLLMAGALTLIQLMHLHEFSETSLALLLVIHMPYMLGFKKKILNLRLPLLFSAK